MKKVISLKQIFTSNISTKLMALFMACALWTYAYFFSLRTEEGKEIPFEISAPEGWSVLEQSAQHLTVTLQFPKHAETKIRETLERGEFRAVYVVEEEPDEPVRTYTNIRLNDENFRFPLEADATVRSYEPASLDFTLAKISSKRVPVELRLSGPPPGFSIRGWWWNPRSVTISGPENVIREVGSVRTEEIQIVAPPVDSERLPAGRISVDTRVDVAGITHEISCNETIEYIIYLSPRTGERTIDDNIKIRVLQNIPTGYNVELPRMQEMRVKVRGPEELIQGVQPADIVLYVDVEGLEPADTPYMQPVIAFVAGIPNAEQIEVIPEETRVPVAISE